MGGARADTGRGDLGVLGAERDMRWQDGKGYRGKGVSGMMGRWDRVERKVVGRREDRKRVTRGWWAETW